MNNSLTRTSMSLDEFTIGALDQLSQKWAISKAAVIRRAVKSLKESADAEDDMPSPLEALDWLQDGGGLLREEAAEYNAELKAERLAKKYWWEEPTA